MKFRLMEVEPVTSPLEFWARVAVLIGAVIWGGWFISTDYEVLRGGFSDIGSSFMHNVNLVFHEAGHVLFMPFGRFMTILGGSLAQLLMPLIVGVTFLWKYHNPFGASMALWWLAQSFMDLAPYINDARRQQLILLGGYSGTHRPGSHDWNNLLGSMGLVQEAGLIAGFVDFLGSGLMILAIVWAGLLLHAQYRHLPR